MDDEDDESTAALLDETGTSVSLGDSEQNPDAPVPVRESSSSFGAHRRYIRPERDASPASSPLPHVPIDPDADIMRRNLNLDQQRCFANVIACLLPNDPDNLQFSAEFFDELTEYLDLIEYRPSFHPLLMSKNINPRPFAEVRSLAETTRSMQ